LNWEKVAEKIVAFIREYVDRNGANGAVLGLSGGIDSACVGFLCKRALGEEKVLALIMPEKGVTSAEDIKDALDVCKILNINCKIIDISPVVASISGIIRSGYGICSSEAGNTSSLILDPAFRKTAYANIKPRIRMILSYFYANSMNRIVVGTGNKSEFMVGYFTKYGDGGCDILPIGDLYKTEVLQLAKHLGIPEKIILKKPSAGLWVGQTDEDEMGISYAKLDRILMLLENKIPAEDIPELAGVDDKDVEKVMIMVKRSAHKRMMPRIPSVRHLI
jgi:NAD+ synthase